jgi:hypothetical protein
VAGNAARQRRLRLQVEQEPTYRRVLGRDVLEVATSGVLWLGYVRLELPAGFRTDGASVPRGGWALVGHPFASQVLLAAHVHDQLYRTQGWVAPGLRLSRAEVDQLFHDMLWLDIVRPLEVAAALAPKGWRRWRAALRLRLAILRCWIMWAAVRCCGTPRWTTP